MKQEIIEQNRINPKNLFSLCPCILSGEPTVSLSRHLI